MFRSLTTTALVAILCVTASSAFAQGAASPAPQAKGPPRTPPPAPLFFREDWKSGTGPGEPAVTQANISNPNLDVKLYGGGTQVVMGGGTPVHLWTGLCDRPSAIALRDKNNYVDLSGLAKIRWDEKVSGLHLVHPIVKLADGTWLLGDHEDSNELDYHPSEFTVSEERWIKLDSDKVVTRGDWLDKSQVDLTKVDEVGFADLMPGSGHGDGGFTDMAWIEVYGKPVPR